MHWVNVGTGLTAAASSAQCLFEHGLPPSSALRTVRQTDPVTGTWLTYGKSHSGCVTVHVVSIIDRSCID